MKKLIIILLAGMFFIPAFSQNVVTDTSVTCVAYWRKGDKKTVSVTITTRIADKNIRTREVKDTYEATMRVIDSTEKNYTIEWINTTKNADLNNFSFDAISSLFSGVRVVYKTDDVGAFASLVNYQEVQDQINKTFDELKKISSGNSVLDSTIQRLKPMLQTRESIEQVVLKEISLFHAPFGGEFAFGNKQRHEIELPNFAGGEPLPAVLTLYLMKKDPAKDVATVAFTQELDQKKGAALIRDIVRRIAPEYADINDDMLPAYLTMTDHNEFDVVISTGWLKRAYLKRTSRTGTFEKVQTYELIIK